MAVLGPAALTPQRSEDSQRRRGSRIHGLVWTSLGQSWDRRAHTAGPPPDAAKAVQRWLEAHRREPTSYARPMSPAGHAQFASLGGPLIPAKGDGLAQARTVVGLSQEALAERVGVDRKTVHRWERGLRRPQPRHRPLIAQALHMTLSDLDALLTQPRAVTRADSTDSLVGSATEMRTAIEAWTSVERRLGGGARDDAGVAVASDLESRLSAIDSSASPQLAAVAAELALRASSMCRDTGDTAGCHRWLSRAGALASHTDDLSLQAWVMARRGEQAVEDGRRDRAVAYTAAGVELARDAAPMARAFVTAKHAMAQAAAGATGEADRMLDHAFALTLMSGARQEPEWMAAYGAAHVQHDAARCHVLLGRSAQALAAADDAVSGRRALPRPRAFTAAVRAQALLRRGDLEQACAEGHELLASAESLQSARVTARLGGLLAAMTPYGSVAAVRNLRDAARGALVGRGS